MLALRTVTYCTENEETPSSVRKLSEQVPAGISNAEDRPLHRVKKLTISLFPRVAALTVVDTRRKADRIS